MAVPAAAYERSLLGVLHEAQRCIADPRQRRRSLQHLPRPPAYDEGRSLMSVLHETQCLAEQRQRTAPPLPPPPLTTRHQLQRPPPPAAYEGSLHQHELASTRAMIRSSGDDDDLTRPEAGDLDAAAAAPTHPALALNESDRLHTLYQRGLLLHQRRMREAREHAQKPWAASATTQAYAASDRITHLYEQGRAQVQKTLRQGRAQVQKAALPEVCPLVFARQTVMRRGATLVSGSAVSRAAKRHCRTTPPRAPSGRPHRRPRGPSRPTAVVRATTRATAALSRRRPRGCSTCTSAACACCRRAATRRATRARRAPRAARGRRRRCRPR